MQTRAGMRRQSAHRVDASSPLLQKEELAIRAWDEKLKRCFGAAVGRVRDSFRFWYGIAASARGTMCFLVPTLEGDAMKRRDFLKSGALAGAAVAGGSGALTAGVVEASEGNKRHRTRGDLVLVNGNIHTMDERNPLVSSVGIRDGRFVEVGGGAKGVQGAHVINLRGATVVPGLIESHTHFVSLANRPGYHVAEWELASSTADVLAALAARRDRGDVPA